MYQDLNCISVILENQLHTAQAYTGLGEKYYATALNLFKQILSQDNQHVPGLLGLGNILLNMAKYEESKRCFEKVLTINPTNINALIDVAWTNYLMGHKEEGLKLLK